MEETLWHSCRFRFWGTFQATLKDALSEYLYRETKRRPKVIPVVLE